jgi:hypothetical protein
MENPTWLYNIGNRWAYDKSYHFNFMTTYEALNEVFSKSNKELSELLQTNYYTVTTWKFQFKRNGLSMEKQFEILQKLNYNLTNQISWNKTKEVR